MKSAIHIILTIAIGLVWLINGLFCKVIGGTPRHELIVAAILGADHATALTVAIGLGEIALAVWFWSGILRRANVWIQMALVFAMNVLEFFLVPELLLWGKLNAFFAACFILTVYFHEFVLRPQIETQRST